MGKQADRWKGAVAGLLGSVVGLLFMRFYWQQVAPTLRQQVTPPEQKGEQGSQEQSGNDQASEWQRALSTTKLYPDDLEMDSISLVGRQHGKKESSTAALGRILYESASGRMLEHKETHELLSYLVHWGYGLGQGSLYGATRAGAAFPDLTGALSHATLAWLLGDELLVPALGLQSGPTAAPPLQHLNRLGAHLAFGVGTAATTQLLQRVL
ncbi:MAG: hypothetical protein R3272_14640 [Candidatus Promineifilaceae bacterium]|nr:hypothetical protein [Candidatus Promineifilaceae bacterium]